MLTFLPLEQINEMDAWEGAQLNTAKEILAYELTKLVHGEEEATKAQSAAKGLFGAGSTEDMPSVALAEEYFNEGKPDILTLLVKTGLVASKSEARRAVEQGGVQLDGEKVTDCKASYDRAFFAEEHILRRGKKSYKKICAM
jgi:tyrosyl-tRNA synthetase